MTDRPMCSNCELHKDTFYAKYENVRSLCDLCQTFQDALFKAIEEEKEILHSTAQNLKK